MVIIQFPDNNIKEFPDGTNAIDVAKSISEGLARNVLAAKVDGEVIDATIPLTQNKKLNFELLTWIQDKGKETMWHSSAHLMAEAIQFFYPKVLFHSVHLDDIKIKNYECCQYKHQPVNL